MSNPVKLRVMEPCWFTPAALFGFSFDIYNLHPVTHRGERNWNRNYLRVVTARVFCVLRCSFTPTSNSGRQQRHLTWSSHPRGAHLLMLQGREINPMFLSPAPGIDPGSAGVRLQHFTYRCNRLRCPLARLPGLQCYNMGHNGHGINLYGVVMTLMGN